MSNPERINLLILSDIHFGFYSEHLDFSLRDFHPRTAIENAKPIKASLIEAVRNSGLSIDAILVPGDLTSKAAPDEFIGCTSAINDIAMELEINKELIFYTFGNHDVNWRITKLAMCNSDEPTIEDHEDSGYLHLGAHIGSILAKNSIDLEEGPLPGTGLYKSDKFELIIANTGYFSHNEQEIPHGRLGDAQFMWLKETLEAPRNSSTWRILMLHHHPFNYKYPSFHHDVTTLAEGAELMQLIGCNYVDFVCHGHRHHPSYKTVQENTWRAPVTLLCAGSVAVDAEHRTNGQIPNLFHIVSLEDRAENGAARGCIYTYQYAIYNGWQQCVNSHATPLDPKQRFGSLLDSNGIAQSIRELLNTANTLSGEYKPLTAYDDLAWDLQCLPIHQLNSELIKNGEELGLSMIGKYPEPVIVKEMQS